MNTNDNIIPYNVDWDNIKTLEELKLMFSLMGLRLYVNHDVVSEEDFDKIKKYLMPIQPLNTETEDEIN